MGGHSRVVEGHHVVTHPVVGLRLPIEDAQAVAPRQAAVLGQDVREEGEGIGGIGHVHADLAHDDRFPVTGDHVIGVGLALGVQGGPVGGGGVKGHADHVPIRSGGF